MTLATLSASADDMVIVKATPGAEDVTIPMSKLGKLTFADGNLIVHEAGSEKTVSYPMADIKRLYFAIEGGVADVFGDASSQCVLRHAPGSDIAAVEGVNADATVYVYDTDGRLVLTSANPGQIDITNLTVGRLYIVMTDGFTAKFIK